MCSELVIKIVYMLYYEFWFRRFKYPRVAIWLFAEMMVNSTLGVLLNWFHLLGTLHQVLPVISAPLLSLALLPTQPPKKTSPHPHRSQECRRVSSQCVGFSSSEAQGHLHTLSLWNGPLVAAPGRAQWCLYQPVKRDSLGLHQVPLSQSNSSQSTDGCSFTAEGGGAPRRDAQSPNQREQTPSAEVQCLVQPNFNSNY